MAETMRLFDFDNSYARELEGFYVPWKGEIAPQPKIVQLNADLAAELNIDPASLQTSEAAAILTGSKSPDGADPLAQVYAGHQFGGFSPQLGDGRALLLGEVIDRHGKRRDLQLKGSGKTPFSRGGDGKAVLGPVLREYLMGEAMNALGIPTTRALAAATTGEEIVREGLKPGAVLTRVASSHLRVGTFQFFAAREEWQRVVQLADYAIDRHDPDLADAEDKYLLLLKRVAERQAALVAKWMSVGFIHGVMNTDNMTISGETIDYGPCAFLDAYAQRTVFSSIDHHGRYAFGNQPAIAQWNLARLAESLLPLISPEDNERAVELATGVITEFMDIYKEHWVSIICRKIALIYAAENHDLVDGLFLAMEGQNVDFTLFFRCLADDLISGETSAADLFDNSQQFEQWLTEWRDRGNREGRSEAERAAEMSLVNPIYIPRNHLVEEALFAAETDGNLSLFESFGEVLAKPFTLRDGMERYTQPAPVEFGSYRTFCGT